MQCCQLKVQIPAALPPLSLSREPQVRLTQVSPSVTWVPRFPSIAQAPPRPTLFISNSDLLPLLMPSRGSTSQRKFFQVLPSTCMLPPPSLPPCCFHRVQAAGGLSPVIASPSSPALCGAHSHTVTQPGQSLVQALPLPPPPPAA